MLDHIPAPSASKAKRGRRRQVRQVQNVMEIIMENMTEIMTENLDEIVDDTTGISKKNVGGGYRKMRKASLKEKGKKPARTCDYFEFRKRN